MLSIISIFAASKAKAMHTILVTGGAGFIGSHLRLFVNKYPNYKIVNIDKHLRRQSGEPERHWDKPNYTFVKVILLTQLY